MEWWPSVNETFKDFLYMTVSWGMENDLGRCFIYLDLVRLLFTFYSISSFLYLAELCCSKSQIHND